MFRMWGKLFKDNHLIRDIVIENDHPTLNRTRKVFSALEELEAHGIICMEEKDGRIDINVNIM